VTPERSTLEAQGEAVLDSVVGAARRAWGSRLVAAYALGSLAHGGFAPLVSDVDVGLVLADPIAPSDVDVAARVRAEVVETGLPLVERLSIFWGSIGSIGGEGELGRFPSYDRADLVGHGRVLWGTDVRDRIRPPDAAELLVESATFALAVLARPSQIPDGSFDGPALLADPERLAREHVRLLTKVILFPVRFLHTAWTGDVGVTADAVGLFAERFPGPEAELATRALAWRSHDPSEAERAALVPLLRTALRPLYVRFVDAYVPRMREAGRDDLADGLLAWRGRLA